MRKIIIKDWPYPKGVKAMLLRVDNPIYDGKGNWYTNVTFRSVLKENRTIPLDWGLLPMLKTGQIFCDGYKVDENRKIEVKTFDFKGADFRFYIDRLNFGEGLIERSVFCAVIDGVYHKIPVIEVVRAFFARTRTLANELLAANNILRLCQCQLDEEKRSVKVQLSLDCPYELRNERWLPSLAWISTDKFARKSWDSFFRYYNFAKESDNTSKPKVVPAFPLSGVFSIAGCYRSYGNNIWIEAIKDIKCKSLDFDEVVGVRYVVECEVDKNKAPRIVPVKKLNGAIGISNSKESATNQTITAEVDLPGLTFVKQPNIRIIKKILNVKKGISRFVQEGETNIMGTGKNPGFINTGKGVEFTDNSEEDRNKTLEMPLLAELKKASEVDLAYNHTLPDFFENLGLVSRSSEVSSVGTEIYELPGENSFAWIVAGIKRCCAISIIRMVNGKVLYAIEADRTIYGYDKRWPVATLLLNIKENKANIIIVNLVKMLSEYGHWEEVKLKSMECVKYHRMRHNDINRVMWAIKMLNTLMYL